MLPEKLNHKKAEGLALQTIVIAAMVLIVLIVIISIFAGKLGVYSKTIDKCFGRESSSALECQQEGKAAVPMKNGKFCCIPFEEKTT